MNYNLIVAKIDEVFEIKEAKNVQGAKILNETIVVGNTVKAGDVGIFAEVDIQLSKDFLKKNNLYREKELNDDKEKCGFFDNSGRVRAQPFLGVRSAGFFFDKSMLEYTGSNLNNLKIGDEFTILNNHMIAEKYSSAAQKLALANNRQNKKNKAIIGFLEHSQTSQFKQGVNSIQIGDILSFHAKRHGSSFRVGKHLVKQNLSFIQNAINSITHREIFPSYEYEIVIGTRRTVLKDKNKQGFHGSEEFRYEVAESLKPFIENGMTIYGEIVGRVNGKPIMGIHNVKKLSNKEYLKKYGNQMEYTYGTSGDEYKFHIYRITNIVNGKEIDLTTKQVELFGKTNNFDVHYKVHESVIYDGNKENLINLVEYLTERPEMLTEDYIDNRHISEGIIIRIDNGENNPTFMKSKSFAFRVLEGVYKESNVDAEDIN